MNSGLRPAPAHYEHRDRSANDDEESDSAVGSASGEAGPGRRRVGRVAVGDGFRVRVSLERFFSDERSRVVLWAERAQPAAWLLLRLRAALPLPLPSGGGSLALLTADGCLLPPDEPLAVLRPDDLLQVIISPVGEKTAAGEEAELEAVKRRALRLLDEAAEGAGPGVEPRRRRRVRRRRAAPATSAPAPAQWRAEHAGVVRAASPPRAARLVPAADT